MLGVEALGPAGLIRFDSSRSSEVLRNDAPTKLPSTDTSGLNTHRGCRAHYEPPTIYKRLRFGAVLCRSFGTRGGWAGLVCVVDGVGCVCHGVRVVGVVGFARGGGVRVGGEARGRERRGVGGNDGWGRGVMSRAERGDGPSRPAPALGSRFRGNDGGGGGRGDGGSWERGCPTPSATVHTSISLSTNGRRPHPCIPDPYRGTGHALRGRRWGRGSDVTGGARGRPLASALALGSRFRGNDDGGWAGRWGRDLQWESSARSGRGLGGGWVVGCVEDFFWSPLPVGLS